jgi:hypothetical protein
MMKQGIKIDDTSSLGMTPNEMSSSLYEVPGVATSQLPIGGDVILIAVQTVLSCTQCFRRGRQHENNVKAAAFF